ncbi:phage holin family protein [Allosphingosinicella sp.]|uniref:phage holin family protein n=1 Tax=Allosphingosinicella sp. TaxID=2823234 RepID=UPI002FC17B7B
MHGRIENPDDNSIGDLVQQLVDEGRNVASAEANLYKQIALYRIGKARTGAIALAAGGFLAFAGLIAALVGLLMGLANLIGPVAAGLVVLAMTGAVGYLLVRYGIGKMAALSGDAEEKAALLTGERNP